MTQLETPSQHSRQLSQLDEAERYRCFDDLQLTMPNVWESMRLDMEDESVVVVPSISIERATPYQPGSRRRSIANAFGETPP